MCGRVLLVCCSVLVGCSRVLGLGEPSVSTEDARTDAATIDGSLDSAAFKDWTIRQRYRPLQHVALTDSLAVACGSHFVRSIDGGLTWIDTIDEPCHDLDLVDGVFYALSSDTLKQSSDGLRWKTSTLPAQINSLAFGNGIFLAIETVNSRAWSSINGLSWEEQDAPIPQASFLNLTFAKDRFFAHSLYENGLWSSLDGNDWGYIDYDFFSGIAYKDEGDEGFFGYGSVQQYSTNGAQWIPIAVQPLFRAAATRGDVFVAATYDRQYGYADDPNVWTFDHETPFLVSELATNGSIVIGMGDAPVSFLGGAGISPWGFHGSGPLLAVTAADVLEPGAVNFVAVGWDGQLLTSSDGATWIARAPALETFADVCFGDGVYLAVSSNGTLLRSEDGIAWTASELGEAAYACAYGASTFVLLAANRIYASQDASEWTLTDEQQFGHDSVVYGDSGFVSAGGGVVGYSPDGLAWTVVGIPGGSRVTFGHDRYLAVNGAYAIVSTNGSSWEEAEVPDGATTGDPIVGSATGLLWITASGAYWSTNAFDWTRVGLGAPPTRSYDAVAAPESSVVDFIVVGEEAAITTFP
jgi:hypothetical protein